MAGHTEAVEVILVPQAISVKVGTIFEDSPLSLDIWMVAMWMLCNCRNGVSSYEIARATGIAQKSAWFLLQRLRLVMKDVKPVMMGATGTPVEMDECFVGGKPKNMHAPVASSSVSA